MTVLRIRRSGQQPLPCLGDNPNHRTRSTCRVCRTINVNRWRDRHREQYLADRRTRWHQRFKWLRAEQRRAA